MSRHGKISADKTQIAVVLPKWVKEELARLAKADRRSLSSYAAWQLELHAQAKRDTDSATLGSPPMRSADGPSAADASASELDLARELRGDGQRGIQGKGHSRKGR